MPNRFYFSARDGTNSGGWAGGYVPSSWSTGWNKTTGMSQEDAPGSLLEIKSRNDSFDAYNTGNGVVGNHIACGRHISPPLLAQTIDGTVFGVTGAYEQTTSNGYSLAFAIKVIKPDGTDRGILLAVTSSDSTAEPPSITTLNRTRMFQDTSESTSMTLSSVVVTEGDMLCVELGARQLTTSTSRISIRNSVLGTDLAFSSGDTVSASQNGWIEFSQDIKLIDAPYFNGSFAQPQGDNTTGTADPTAVTMTTRTPGPLAGDLILMIAQGRAASMTLAISSTGGQSWTTEAAISTTNQTSRLFWCKFNGTWTSDPSVSFGATTCNSVTLHWFHPPWSASWSVNQALVELDIAAAATQTITGQTTTGTNPTITIAYWSTPDDNTWGSISGTNWLNFGYPQFRNTSGSDQSQTFAYKIQKAAGATGNVSKTQLTNGNDVATTFIITFAAARINTLMFDPHANNRHLLMR